ncbi:MAG: hypothetical protein ABR923_03470 [Terracidiphilus sp.]|jgi:hypothetical protein
MKIQSQTTKNCPFARSRIRITKFSEMGTVRLISVAPAARRTYNKALRHF